MLYDTRDFEQRARQGLWLRNAAKKSIEDQVAAVGFPRRTVALRAQLKCPGRAE